MVMKKNVQLIIFALFATLNGVAQVTIGSAIPPLNGAILDLKEFTPQTVGGATATKGLLLPRLKLSEVTSLVDVNGVDPSEQIVNTGLMVYNVTNDKCKTLSPGVYSWTGKEWNRLGGAVQYTVGTLEDNRVGDIPQKYATAHFVAIDETTSEVLADAGEWMLENLKAKVYASGVTPTQSLAFNNGRSDTDAYYSYPNNDPSRFEREGYYYSGIAALNSQIVDGIYNGVGTLPTRKQQGICPDGWRVPTYEDWKALEAVIQQSECEFAFPKPQENKYLGGLIVSNGTNGNYTARPVEEGGFAAFASGSYESDGTFNNVIGEQASFITTYPVPVTLKKNGTTIVYPMYGSFSFTDADKFAQFHTSTTLAMPVRCIKGDNIPAQVNY